MEIMMKAHRVNELIELFHPQWQQDNELSLLQFISKLANEAGYNGAIDDLTDDILIYHLKMRNMPKEQMIPGLAKDHIEDFRTALLEERGILK